MTRFVKSCFFGLLALGCLAVGSAAQQQPSPAPDFGTPLPVGQNHGAYGSGFGVSPYSMGPGGSDPASQLARQIVDAKTEVEKEKLKDALKETLNKQFDSRQKHHEKEIADLEAQLKKLKEMVAKRQENKKEIIDEKLKQLEREARGLGW
jgi:hypothetical protein